MASTIENYGQIAWIKITYQGKTHTLTEWSKILGIDYHALRMRYKRGHRGLSLFFKRGIETTYAEEAINKYINHLRRQKHD